jgi:hypothetical protein
MPLGIFQMKRAVWRLFTSPLLLLAGRRPRDGEASHCHVHIDVVVVAGPAKMNWGPELNMNRVPGVIEAPLFVCAWTYSG